MLLMATEVSREKPVSLTVDAQIAPWHLGDGFRGVRQERDGGVEGRRYFVFLNTARFLPEHGVPHVAVNTRPSPIC